MNRVINSNSLPPFALTPYAKLVKSVGLVVFSSTLMFGCNSGDGGDNNDAVPPVVEQGENLPTRSSSLALTSDDTRLVVVNRENNTVSVIQVRDESGADIETLLGEVAVGTEPHFVALSPDDTKAFVTNAVDGTVSIIDISAAVPAIIGDPIAVGTEPRGITLSPNGKYAYVANHTEGTVSVISTTSASVVNTVSVGGNPMAITITHDGDEDDRDEQVYVTRFFSEVIDPVNRPDGFNDSKQGKVVFFSVESSLSASPVIQEHTLKPLVNAGFAADRRQFCQQTRDVLQNNGEEVFFNSGADQLGNGAASLKNEIFCPDTGSTDASEDGEIAKTPQGAYTNNLFAAMIRNNTLYIPNVGASPEPPVKFNVNVQALISSIDLSSGVDTTLNLNEQIKTETQPNPDVASLDRLFGNDIVDIDANANGDQFLILSRGGNYVMRAGVDNQGNLDIAANSGVVRFKTGNIPNGIVMSHDGKRAYTNNEVNLSVTSIDLENNLVMTQDIASSEPPEPGTQAHRNLLGKLVFYTALGTPDTFDTDGDGVFDIEVRDIDPLTFRGKASDNAWSSCASCHNEGHSDNVTWIFPTGPRQTIPLEGMFAATPVDIDGQSTFDQRILNWNAVRGSATDFNNNARGVQGGVGFASDVQGEDKTAEVFNHGPTQGVSDALDAMTEWVANAVRTPIMPDVDNDIALESGRETFTRYCAACHSGEKWTKSSTAFYDNDPTFLENPLGSNFFAGVTPRDSNLLVAGPQINAIRVNEFERLAFLDDVGTLVSDNVLEIRGAGRIAGQSTQGFPALGGIGFNTPSLLGVGFSSPYLHDGSAITMDDVFAVHTLPEDGGATINELIVDTDALSHLASFVLSIDEQTPVINVVPTLVVNP